MTTKSDVPMKTEKFQYLFGGRDPFELLHQEVARFLAHSRRFGSHLTGRCRDPGLAWAPPMDVFQQGSKLVILADLPGIDPESIDVTLEDGYLSIRGEHRSEQELEQQDHPRRERSEGSFHQRLALPFVAQTERVEATYENGRLEITVPKLAELRTGPRTIPVN